MLRIKCVEILDVVYEPVWVRNAVSTYTRLRRLFLFENFKVSKHFFKILYGCQSLRTTFVLFPSSGKHESFAVPFRDAHNCALRRLEVILTGNQSNVTANLRSWLFSHQNRCFSCVLWYEVINSCDTTGSWFICFAVLLKSILSFDFLYVLYGTKFISAFILWC
jgi:hypothetical protein